MLTFWTAKIMIGIVQEEYLCLQQRYRHELLRRPVSQRVYWKVYDLTDKTATLFALNILWYWFKCLLGTFCHIHNIQLQTWRATQNSLWNIDEACHLCGKQKIDIQSKHWLYYGLFQETVYANAYSRHSVTVIMLNACISLFKDRLESPSGWYIQL